MQDCRSVPLAAICRRLPLLQHKQKNHSGESVDENISNEIGGVKDVLSLFFSFAGTRGRVHKSAYKRSGSFSSLDSCFRVHPRCSICLHFISSVLPTKHLFGHSGQDELFDLPRLGRRVAYSGQRSLR